MITNHLSGQTGGGPTLKGLLIIESKTSKRCRHWATQQPLCALKSTDIFASVKRLSLDPRGILPKHPPILSMASNHTKTRRPETQFDLAGVGLQRDGPDQKERNTPETSTLDFALNHLGKSSNATSSQPHASEQPAASSDRRSPWKSYKKLFALQFGNSLHYTVAEKTTITSGMTCVVLMKKIEGSKDDHSMRLIETIKHDRFVPVVEVFPAKKACFVAFEFFPISLAEFTGNPLMNELILASILSQVAGRACTQLFFG